MGFSKQNCNLVKQAQICKLGEESKKTTRRFCIYTLVILYMLT
uniref:Uncharacterized protein n=1 Tax=Anguilla anguilla TaxID=7936 RepID=A0A0E9UR95_ANGAN